MAIKRLDDVRLVALSAIVLLGCAPQGPAAQDAATASGKPLVDIPSLIHKSPDQIAAVLGQPTKVVKITDDFRLMPGSDNYYKPKAAGEDVIVRFHRKSAIFIEIDLPKPVNDPLVALQLAGLKPVSKPYITAPTAQRWRDDIGGVVWKDVSATSGGGIPAAQAGYTKVMATAADAP